MSPIPSLSLQTWERSAKDARTRRRTLVFCLAGGLLVPTYFLGIADVSHFAWDFRAYYTAAQAALHGDPFIGLSPGLPGVSYVYPPVSITLFLPHTAAGSWQRAFAVQTILNVVCALFLAGLTVWTIERHSGRLPPVDRVLVTGFCLGTAPIMAIFGQGQLDVLIAVALAGAFLAVERGRQVLAGVALAGAALIKVFPVVLGLWLVWRRAWRALVAAVLTGVSGLVLGALLFGLDAYRRYLDVLAGRSRLAEFAGTVSPNFFAMSLYRPFSQLLPNLDPSLYAPLSLLALAPTVILVAPRRRRFTDRLTTYLVALTAMLLVSPASNALYVVYVYFPLLCLLYVGVPSRGHSLLLFGTVLITFPVQPAQVSAVLSLGAVPVPIASAVVAAVRVVLTVVSLPLGGLLAILVWCTLRATGSRKATAAKRHPAKSD
ncbi:glycosyltransferase family 87 protein [Halorientalis brevis]|uniref:Glycosyltransferase family 87 protein n=1 Tax=Halorientalis brevis TaxID=1126241 RepID=A0ABD6CEQ6_9EURY|nr:glycosyltransferase family 87 protein [Halorientalis brevis]